MKKTIISIIVVLCVLVLSLYFYTSYKDKEVKEDSSNTSKITTVDNQKPVSRLSLSVEISGNIIPVEVASTEEARIKGLSGRESLPQGTGLLFMFDTPGNYGIWMKDMLFPIDIIWIGQDYKITHIEKNVSPDTFPTIFYPKSLSMYVLELPSGQANLVMAKVGDTTKFRKE